MATAIPSTPTDRVRHESAKNDRSNKSPRYESQNCCSEPVTESRHLQPLVMISALNAVILGIALNCSFSTTAPLAVFVLLATAQTAASYWILLRVHAHHAIQERLMARLIESREDALSRTREAFFVGLSHLAKSRDQDTDGHVERVGQNSTVLAAAARQHPKFANQIDDEFIRLIGVSSVLHDIGKVGISDSVLNKPGALTASEREHMQGHTHISRNCLSAVEKCLGDANFLQMAQDIAEFHHERWDGTGYPCGLKGANIPLAARIVAIADVYDALAQRRVYKDALPHADCVSLIQDGRGSHFDPELVDLFVTIADRFAESVPSNTSEVSVAEIRGHRALDVLLSDVDSVLTNEAEAFEHEPNARPMKTWS